MVMMIEITNESSEDNLDFKTPLTARRLRQHLIMTVKWDRERAEAYLTVPCNPSQIRGSGVQLVGLFQAFQHTC